MFRSSFLLVFLIPVLALAYSNPGQPSGFVNDFAGMLSAEQKQQLETKLTDFEKTTGNEIAVATIPNLGGDTIENFAVKLFEEWKIGKAKNDNGVLLLIAKDDREMRIEVGYGLEGALTDAQSYWIIQNIMRPAFQAGDYDAGIIGAVDKILAATKGEYVPSANQQSAKNKIGWNFNTIETFGFFGLFIFMWLGAILARSKSWWAGGVIGAIAGIILIFVFSWIVGAIAILILTPLGLLFDYAVSKTYQKHKSSGTRFPWWIGGFGGHGSGGGSFGGFGGGSSGGGGASGSW